MKRHTPAPYRLVSEVHGGTQSFAIESDVTGQHVATADDAEDAAFIVLACNAHDELVAALRLAREYVAHWPYDSQAAELATVDAALAKVTP